LADATSKWITGSYHVGRLVVGTSPVAGRVVLSSYKKLRPLVRRLRGRPAEVGAEGEPAARPVPDDQRPILELIG
jgi:hypothetical protein